MERVFTTQSSNSFKVVLLQPKASLT